MNLYKEQRDRHQKRVEAFFKECAFFAFSKEQFADGLRSLGLTEDDADKLVKMPGGGFMLKDRTEDLLDLLAEINEEQAEAISDPDTGRKFAEDMFYYELVNHEYSYTDDTEETLEALGYTLEDIEADQTLKDAFEAAKKRAGAI